MLQWMRDLGGFLASCWRSTIARFTGGLLAAYMTYIYFYPPQHVPPVGVLWGAAACYCFLSAFGAWRKEHIKALGAEDPLYRHKDKEVADGMAQLTPSQRGIVRDVLLGHPIKFVMVAVTGVDPNRKEAADVAGKCGRFLRFDISPEGLITTLTIVEPYHKAVERYFSNH